MEEGLFVLEGVVREGLLETSLMVVEGLLKEVVGDRRSDGGRFDGCDGLMEEDSMEVKV